MLRNIYIPSQAEAEDLAPEIPLERKLEELAAAIPKVTPVIHESLDIPVEEDCYDAHFYTGFRRIVPYVKGLRFQLEDKEDHTELFIHRIDLGDAKLQGNGLGSRLLQKVVEFGLESKDDLTTVTIGVANMGLVNTLRKVLNDEESDEEHVAFRKGAEWYGEGHAKELEEVYDDVPYRQGNRYLVHEVRASIDREQFLARLALGEQPQTSGQRLVS